MCVFDAETPRNGVGNWVLFFVGLCGEQKSYDKSVFVGLNNDDG